MGPLEVGAKVLVLAANYHEHDGEIFLASPGVAFGMNFILAPKRRAAAKRRERKRESVEQSDELISAIMFCFPPCIELRELPPLLLDGCI